MLEFQVTMQSQLLFTLCLELFREECDLGIIRHRLLQNPSGFIAIINTLGTLLPLKTPKPDWSVKSPKFGPKYIEICPTTDPGVF